MHTLILHDENGDVIGRAHHNSDWSGQAIFDDGGGIQVVMSAEVLRAAACSIALKYLRTAAEEYAGETDIRVLDIEDTLLAGHVVRSAYLKR